MRTLVITVTIVGLAILGFAVPAGQHVREPCDRTRQRVLREHVPAVELRPRGAVSQQLLPDDTRRAIARIARPAFGCQEQHLVLWIGLGEKIVDAGPVPVERVA